MENDSKNADAGDDSAPALAQLVAYLDGELDDDASRAIEERLTTDSTLREQLSRLERTWDALDQLGYAEVDEKFTQSTIEMVAVAAEEERREDEQKRPMRRRRRWLIAVVGLLISFATGFTVAAMVWPDPNEPLLDNLPILERLDEYQQVDNIEFLELLLQNEELFRQEGEHDDA